MEPWQKVWRDGFAPLISINNIKALQKALETDDPKLLQGCTTQPPPLICVQNWPVEAACAISYCGVIENGGFGSALVIDVEEYFAKLCFECDKILGEYAGCRHFLNWADDTPREEMRMKLLEEIKLELNRHDILWEKLWESFDLRMKESDQWPEFIGDSK